MSLDIARLEKLRELPGGIVQARCPACAEGGHDGTGNHLRIYPDGRFGCCVHPKDNEHRKRIFALAGVKADRRSDGSFGVRVRHSTGQMAGPSVKAALSAVSGGLPVPPKTELENGVRGVRDLSAASAEGESRTPRTGVSQLRARAREGSTAHIDIGGDFQEKLKDSGSGVRGVRALRRVPHLTAGGDLVIPFDGDAKYHYWKPGGQPLAQTLAEVRAGLIKEEDAYADDV